MDLESAAPSDSPERPWAGGASDQAPLTERGRPTPSQSPTWEPGREDLERQWDALSPRAAGDAQGEAHPDRRPLRAWASDGPWQCPAAVP